MEDRQGMGVYLAVAKLAVTGLLLCLVSTEELKMVCPVSKGFYP